MYSLLFGKRGKKSARKYRVSKKTEMSFGKRGSRSDRKYVKVTPGRRMRKTSHGKKRDFIRHAGRYRRVYPTYVSPVLKVNGEKIKLSDLGYNFGSWGSGRSDGLMNMEGPFPSMS